MPAESTSTAWQSLHESQPGGGVGTSPAVTIGEAMNEKTVENRVQEILDEGTRVGATEYDILLAKRKLELIQQLKK